MTPLASPPPREGVPEARIPGVSAGRIIAPTISRLIRVGPLLRRREVYSFTTILANFEETSRARFTANNRFVRRLRRASLINTYLCLFNTRSMYS